MRRTDASALDRALAILCALCPSCLHTQRVKKWRVIYLGIKLGLVPPHR
jgi:hypothetical protein